MAFGVFEMGPPWSSLCIVTRYQPGFLRSCDEGAHHSPSHRPALFIQSSWIPECWFTNRIESSYRDALDRLIALHILGACCVM